MSALRVPLSAFTDLPRPSSAATAPPPAHRLACPYCGAGAELVTGEAIYPHRPDLAAKRFYRCAPCGAWVGCHPGTTAPLGRLADAALRRAKQRVHAVFDPHWQSAPNRHRARIRAYMNLARELGIDPAECHVGMFSLELCERAEAIVRAWGTP